MTKKETVDRNIGLTFDYVNYLIENPSIAENLPENFKLEFIEKDFPKIENKTKGKLNTIKKSVRVKNSFEFVEVV